MPVDYLERWPFRVGQDCEYRHPWVDADGRILAWELKVKDPKLGQAARLIYRPSPMGPIGGIAEGDYIQNGREGAEFACWHKFTEEKLRKEAHRRRCPSEGVPVRRLAGVSLPLWGLPEVLEGVATGKTIVLVGGPKDAETARRILDPEHYVSTAWHGGEGSFRKEQAETLRGARVLISLDNDDAGRKGSEKAASMLRNVARSVRIAEPLGWRAGYDLTDLVEELERAGKSPDDIRREVTAKLELGSGPEPDPLTDAGNAYRFARLNRSSFRYCHPWKSWLRWDGARWARDEAGAAKQAAIESAQSIYEDAAKAKTPDEAKDSGKWAKSSLSAGRLRATLELACSHPALAVVPADLDADPWFLNLLNGGIDLQSGRFTPQGSERPPVTKVAGTVFDPDAECPTWDGFLQDVLIDEQGRTDADLVGFMQRAAGLSLTGITTEHVLLFLWGAGSNGKTVFFETLLAALGDYGHVMPFSALLAKDRSGGPQHELADLHGKRFVIAAESPQDARFSEEKVKRLTGGDSITADRKYENSFTFKATHKIWIAANHRPRVCDLSEGFWRRVKLVPCRARFYKPDDVNRRGKPCDLEMEANLQAEMPGILQWMLRGLAAWRRDGLGSCAAIEAASAEYREEENILARFLRERVTEVPGSKVEKPRLFAAYSEFCRKSQETCVTRRAFADTLRSLGYADGRTGKARFWKGLRLIEDVDGDAGDASDAVSRTFPRKMPSRESPEKSVTSVTSVTPEAQAGGDSSLHGFSPGGEERPWGAVS